VRTIVGMHDTTASAPTTTSSSAPLHAAQLELIERDAAHLGTDPDGFARRFYDRVFAIAPAARGMFPADLADQRDKLMRELGTLVTMAVALRDGGAADGLVGRLRRLGARHVGYGVAAPHYDVVGAGLLDTLATTVPDWDAGHHDAWAALYGLAATHMQAGAADAQLTSVEGA